VGEGWKGTDILAIRFALSLLLLVVSSAVSAQLAGELAHLDALADEPEALVDGARRFDLQQKKLIDWDLSLIEGYRREGKADLAATKQDDIRRRVMLMRQAWEFVTARYPNNARGQNYYGEFLYDFAKQQEKAVQAWRVAIGLDDELAGAHNNLGIHYFHTGDYKRGLKRLQRALELEDDNPDFLFNMAQMYLIHFPDIQELLDVSKEKLYREAMEMSKEAAKLSPEDYELQQDYATNFYASENFGVEADWEEAARAWQTARAQAHTDVQTFFTYLNEGRTWIRSGKLKNAIVPLEAAAALKPDSSVVAQLLTKAKGDAG